MTNPPGMRTWHHPLGEATHAKGDMLMVYSSKRQIVLQVRRSVPTTDDLLTTSFKVAVELTATDALALAGELLSVVSILLANPGE